MRIKIAYDQDGNIVNVARVWALPENIPHRFADLTEELRALAIEEPEGELRTANLSDIPHQFRINTRIEELIARRRRSILGNNAC